LHDLSRSGFWDWYYAHRDGKKATPIALEDDEAPWPCAKDVWCILPCRGPSQLFAPRHAEHFEAWFAHVERLRVRFGSSFFLALTPPTIAPEHNAFDNHVQAHLRSGIPLVATPDVFFHAPERKELHDLLCAVRHNVTREDSLWACARNRERTFHTPTYFQRFFSRDPMLRQALANNAVLAQGIAFGFGELRYKYPQEFIPEGFTPQGYLEHCVQRACEKRYGENVPPVIVELLEKELLLIADLAYADYFLTVHEIVLFARGQGILCQGRGSAANSAVCFVLGITAIDPEKFDLVFERFISRERAEPPDIDVDFEHERREEVIQHIYERYGRTRAAMVANVITFRKKGALRAVGKALGFSERELSTISGVFVDRFSHLEPLETILATGIEQLPAERQEHARGLVDVWARLTKDLIGFPRHLGVHSGGFVVSHEPLSHLVPLEPATMENRTVIQWCKDDIEALGLFKIDILALGMLTAIRKTVDLFREHGLRLPGTLRPITLDAIPQGCEKTYEMIRRAETTGVFQIESRAQMSMLPRLLPRVFYDLVIEVAIVRPGPIVGKMVHPFLRRRHGLEPEIYPDERLRPILARTLGVPIFQEQVMRIAVAVGNFTPGEADQLRRAMGAWKFTGNMKGFDEKLLSGMRANNIPDDFAQGILGQIQGFSEYGFPESHAASFALLAYVSSWLKAHYPVYFLCGLLNSQPLGFYSEHSLLQESRHQGHTHLPPCIVHSRWDSAVVPARNGAPSTTLRLGLRLLASLRKEHCEEFVARRMKMEEALAKSVGPDLGGANGANSRLLEFVALTVECFSSLEQITLVMAGVFSMFEKDRRTVLWLVLARPSLLRPDADIRRFAPRASLLEAWDNLLDDNRQMRTSFGPHTMTLLKETAWPFAFPVEKITRASELARLPDARRVTVAGLALVRQMPPTAKGMMFITLEDETGTINLVLQPQVSQKYRAVLVADDLLCITARKQKNGTQSTLLVEVVHEPMVVKVSSTRSEVVHVHQGSEADGRALLETK